MEVATVTTDTSMPALYVVCDKRRDGRLRVLAQYREPKDAMEHARMLRWAGDVVEVHLVTRFEEAAP